jgi:hypothetical protein
MAYSLLAAAAGAKSLKSEVKVDGFSFFSGRATTARSHLASNFP